MGIIQLSPYTRVMIWRDPRTKTGVSSISQQVYEASKEKRNKGVEGVSFDQQCLGKIYDIMENYADKNLRLGPEAFGKCMDDIGVDRELHDPLFKKFDSDGDGDVDPEEFCETLDAIVKGGNNQIVLQSCFDLFDIQRKGHVGHEDMEDALLSLKGKQVEGETRPTREQISVMARIVYHNRETTNKMVTFYHFVNLCAADSTLLTPFINHILVMMVREQIS